MILKKWIDKIHHHHHHHHETNDTNQASSSSESEPISSISSTNSILQRNSTFPTLTDNNSNTKLIPRRPSFGNDNSSNKNSKNSSSSIYHEAENETNQFYASSTSSHSDGAKFENDFDDLHLHHDHNTKHLFRNIHHSDKLVLRLNEMRK